MADILPNNVYRNNTDFQYTCISKSHTQNKHKYKTLFVFNVKLNTTQKQPFSKSITNVNQPWTIQISITALFHSLPSRATIVNTHKKKQTSATHYNLFLTYEFYCFKLASWRHPTATLQIVFVCSYIYQYKICTIETVLPLSLLYLLCAYFQASSSPKCSFD